MLAMFKKQIKIDPVNYEVINRRTSSNAKLGMLCKSRDVDDLKELTRSWSGYHSESVSILWDEFQAPQRQRQVLRVDGGKLDNWWLRVIMVY